MPGTVHTDLKGATGWLVFDNAERQNALTLDMWRMLPDKIDRLEADPRVRVIALVGAGERAFCAGADISEFETVRASAEGSLAYDEAVDVALARLRECPVPTVASIRGYCMGGGMGLALACDLRYARDDARFAIPAARLGVGYAYGPTRDLVHAVGPAMAREILYTARSYTAKEAERIGLVNRVFAPGLLSPAVFELCETMAANAPMTLRTAKRAIFESIAASERAREDLVNEMVRDCFASGDYVEGRRAFMEKRRPHFQGK